MLLITLIISVIISIFLLKWLLGYKKDNPFPKRSALWMVVGGGISTVMVGIVTVIISAIVLVSRIGMDQLMELFSNPTSEQSSGIIAGLNEGAQASLLGTFLNTFIVIALMEEGFKYLVMRWFLKKPGVMTNWFDIVICAAIVGIGFQLVEDLTYANGNIISSICRAVMPFHFVFGAIMGYFYGKAVKTGKKINYWIALLLPVLIHGMFDFSLRSTYIEEKMFMFALVMVIVMLVLTIVIICKIKKWSKVEDMTVSLL